MVQKAAGAEAKNLPDSTKRFPDSANYRIEVSGIETAEILRAVIDEAKKQDIPIHRAIATVAGSKFYSDSQLKELAMLAAADKIEVIICPGDLARQVIKDPNKIFTMLNWQNCDEAVAYYQEVMRCIKLGFRGFLVWRKGLLHFLSFNRKRNAGRTIPNFLNLGAYDIPRETIFKLSTFDNNANIYDFMLAEKLGADTVNTTNGLCLANLASIRSIVNITMDVHITFWQMFFWKNEHDRPELSIQPYDRIKDAPEIARLCSPVYFKFEAGTPGIGVYDVPRQDWTFKDLAEHKRKDVRVAAKIVRTIEKKYPHLVLSNWGPEDLRVPKV